MMHLNLVNLTDFNIAWHCHGANMLIPELKVQNLIFFGKPGQ